ncbi:MAG: hypothetical protein NC389_02100 [Acetatifactor muris]|nr:hypothetical protein [Acetatifactor muris]
MKKKILALICAMALTAGMSMSVCAAGSANAGAIAGSGSASAGAVANSTASRPAPAEQLVTSGENASGQVITTNTLAFFQEDTKVSGVAGASVRAVTPATAKAMIAQARTIAGANTFIASIVDLQVPAGTGAATFTLTCSNVWKGQNVTILHQKSDGSFESIKPSSVEDNKVTFTMTSYSPVAIVINTGAVSPKTGDIIMLAAAMTAISGIGAAFFARKARKSN